VRYLLDTTFGIDFLRGDAAAVDRFEQLFEQGDEPYVNDVVLCELAVGSRAVDDPVFEAFIRAIAFVQPGPDAALSAGSWRAEARRRGLTLSLSDALIAAAAMSLEATVLTRNLRDFGLTPATVSAY
jgi:predicted nucleic acid-binding protein